MHTQYTQRAVKVTLDCIVRIEFAFKRPLFKLNISHIKWENTTANILCVRYSVRTCLRLAFSKWMLAEQKATVAPFLLFLLLSEFYTFRKLALIFSLLIYKRIE